MEGLGLPGVQEVFLASYGEMRIQSRIVHDEGDNVELEYPGIMESFPITRTRKNTNDHRDKDPPTRSESDAIHTPAGEQ